MREVGMFALLPQIPQIDQSVLIAGGGAVALVNRIGVGHTSALMPSAKHSARSTLRVPPGLLIGPRVEFSRLYRNPGIAGGVFALHLTQLDRS